PFVSSPPASLSLWVLTPWPPLPSGPHPLVPSPFGSSPPGSLSLRVLTPWFPLPSGPHPLSPSPFGRGGTRGWHVVPPLRIAERGSGGEDEGPSRRDGQGVRTKAHRGETVRGRGRRRMAEGRARREDDGPPRTPPQRAKTSATHPQPA